MATFNLVPTWANPGIGTAGIATWFGPGVPDGTIEPWKSAPIDSLYMYKPSNTAPGKLYMKIADNSATADWLIVMSQALSTGFVPVSLASLMEISSNAIYRPLLSNITRDIAIPLKNLMQVSGNAIKEPLRTGAVTKRIDIPLENLRESSSDALPNGAGNGGLLASDTTPIFNYTNGATDSALRLSWAATNVDPVIFQVGIPSDYDEASDITFSVLAAMAGATDIPTLTLASFFDVGDTSVADTTAAVTGVTPARYSATIAAADIPAAAMTASIEITPGAHGTDILYIYAVWLEYTVAATPKLATINGDTDSAFAVTWAASDVTPVAFQIPVPADYDETADMTVTLYGKMSGATNTPVVSLDTYFDVGDTKVEDDTTAFGSTVALETATIAAADIPASAVTMTIEMTPGAHTTDTLILYAVKVTYSVAATPKLNYANGDTDSGWLLTWVASDQTPVAFQIPLPPDLDDAGVVEVHFRVKSGGATDTPVLDIDSYFNEGDTKVEDATAAITASFSEKLATIAAVDVPSGAQTLTVEITPGAHSTDTVVVSAVWLEYARA